MRTLLTLLGSLTVTAQPATLFINQSGLITYNLKTSDYETVMDKGFELEGISNTKNKNIAYRHKDWSIDRSKILDSFQDKPTFNKAFKTNYKEGSHIEEKLYVSKKAYSGEKEIIFKYDDLKNDFEPILDIKADTLNPENFVYSFTTVIENGFRVEDRYLIYKIPNEQKIRFYDTKYNKEINNISIELKNSKIKKIYSPDTKSSDKGNWNSIFILTEEGEILRYNLSNYLEINGDLDNTKQILLDDSQKYENESIIGSENIKVLKRYNENKLYSGGIPEFFMGNDGQVTYRPLGNEFYSQSDNFTKKIAINFADAEKAEDMEISYITNTKHAKDKATENSLEEYTILAARNITDLKNSSAIYYVEPNSNKAIKLFDLKPDQTKPNEGTGWDNSLTPRTESNDVINMITYYNNITNQFNITVSTDLGAYNYAYNTLEDLKSATVEKTMFFDSYETDLKESSNLIIQNSFMYYNGELMFNHTITDESNKDDMIRTYSSSLVKRYNLKNLVTTPWTLKLSDEEEQEFIKLNQDDKIKFFKNKYEKYLIEEINDTLYRHLFSRSVINEDYIIQVNDKEKDVLFPATRYGDIKETGIIQIVANEESNFTRFTGKQDQEISVNYSNRYNLTNLNEELSKLWKNEVVYEDFNHAIGFIYKSIEQVLSDVDGFKNEYLPNNEIYNGIKPQYELNNWYGEPASNTPKHLKNWGIFVGDNPQIDENGYVQITLDNIWITTASKPEDNKFFFVKDKENKEETNIVNDGTRVWTKLPNLRIKVKYVEALKNYGSAMNLPSRKMNLEKGVKEVSKIQFNGLGLTTSSTDVENMQQLEKRLNNHHLLSPGYGLALIEGQKIYSLNQFESKIKVRLYDRAWGIGPEGRTPAKESSLNSDTYNYITVKITVYGLKKASDLPAWLTPVFAVTGLLIGILFLTTVWFISRKRFYKSAIGKEGAKVAHAKMKEEQIRQKQDNKTK